MITIPSSNTIISGSVSNKTYNNKVITVYGGGSAKKITAKSSIIMVMGGTITSIKLASSAALGFADMQSSGLPMFITNGKSNKLLGYNVISDSSITGGTITKKFKLGNNTSITALKNANMSSFHVDVTAASLVFKGLNNSLGSMKLGTKTKVSYNISSVARESNHNNEYISSQKFMLSLRNKNTQNLGSFSITVKKNQRIGTYMLSDNLVQKKNKTYTINLGTKKLGIARLNGTSLTKNGVVYSIKQSNNHIMVQLSLKKGKVRLATNNETVARNHRKALTGTQSTTLTGNKNRDIYYCGTGNDLINGLAGLDVAVYDKNNWGQDTIASTDGTMTIMFAGVKKTDLVFNHKGRDLVVTRKHTNQNITVKEWHTDTHNIVYESQLSALHNYLKSSTPSNSQLTAARNEIFKKAGLANT